MVKIVDGDLEDERLVAMLTFHFDPNIAVTPPGSAHVFDVSRLKAPDISFWTAESNLTFDGTIKSQVALTTPL